MLELIHAFEAATGQKVPILMGERRFGDVGTLICDPTLALAELDWAPKYDLPRMCKNIMQIVVFASLRFGSGPLRTNHATLSCSSVVVAARTCPRPRNACALFVYKTIYVFICRLYDLGGMLFQVYNLGTGKASSVLDLIKTFEQVSGKKVPYILEGRRHGDIVAMYANPTLALEELEWTAQHDLLRMCNIYNS